jgi:hypothetical protein
LYRYTTVGDTQMEGAVDEFHVVSDYEGTKLQLVLYPLAYDKRVPDACPDRVDLTPETWDELVASQPKKPDELRRECLENLVLKSKAALESGDAAFEEGVMHGMWELAVKKEHLPDFPAVGLALFTT